MQWPIHGVGDTEILGREFSNELWYPGDDVPVDSLQRHTGVAQSPSHGS